MAGEEPSQEEMSKCAEHCKFTDEEMKECSTNGKDDNTVEGDGDTDQDEKEPPKKIAGKEGEGDPNDKDTADYQKDAEKSKGIETSADTVDLVLLTGTDNPRKQAGLIAGWKEAAMNVVKLSARIEELEKKHDTEKRAELIARGKREGKLTPPLIRLYANKSIEEFEAFLSAQSSLPGETLRQVEPGNERVQLSHAEVEVARMSGRDPAALTKFVQDQQTKQVEWADTTVNADVLASYLNPKEA